MLTAKEIIEKEYIVLNENVAKDFGISLSPAQMGVDLHVIGISKVSTPGFLPKEGKTKTSDTQVIEPTSVPFGDKIVKAWKLEPGDYEIELAEGCNIPPNAASLIIHRSSVRRCGATIQSPLWDPGFKTERMGTFMHCSLPFTVEVGARVAQMVFFDSKEDAELYNGQFQGCSTKERDSKK